MFRTSRRISDLETRLASLAIAVAELRTQREASAPAELLKLIANIQTDIDVTRASLRSLHGKVAIEKRLDRGNGRAAGDVPDDGEFRAMLDLQNGFRSNS